METRIAVVGLGRMGAVHARSVAHELPDARLAAVCDVRQELARATAGSLGCAWYTDMARMLQAENLDAVVVATPSSVHVEPLEAALGAGKAVFCEKPLASTIEDTERCAASIRRAGLPFMLAFNRRFDPAYREARRLQDRHGLHPLRRRGPTRARGRALAAALSSARSPIPSGSRS